ncbi:LysR family transcriptional regulator [Actinomycetospora termitidis]|uniref:LysR family transcriptional regulator n=1 Tax=Actinomycetospora termitidis TaxID=3053470 RepID=A0ABT7M7N3_9PSEU|nr:LysR family transcriptional regulator [Actinomycetospora sp. Odt1-22]MDL5156209.1 LysR family transcriptional regulator [Actinomycetospora sp. Odt1-22]
MDRDSLLQHLDLNLLVAFDVLIDECSVTRAAERLSVGQPAMSASLARMRKFFGDPLLVRDGRTLRPTSTALELVAPIRDALDTIESTVRAARDFDPRTDRRTFTLMASDFVLLVLLRPLLAELEHEAPNLRLTVRPTTPDAGERLARDELDLLVLPTELLGRGAELRSAPLFTERLLITIDRDHPDVGETITEQQFRELPYLAYEGRPGTTISDLRLRRLGIERHVDVATQSFVIQPLMLPGTRMVALLHERLVAHFAPTLPIRVLDPPFDVPPLTEAMFWSPRTDADPAHRWLRDRVRHAAAALD